MLADPTPIEERSGITREIFETEILPAARPVIMRGLAADWPVVVEARKSPEDFCNYLKKFDNGEKLPNSVGPPSNNGYFHYDEAVTRLNFQYEPASLQETLDFFLNHLGDEHPPSRAIQAAPAPKVMAGFAEENSMPLLDDSVIPRLWIGNRITVAAHHDRSENIACVAAGRRRFTLFPPDQLPNLYLGPFEITPGGAPVSMVNFDKPDLERFPRFADAMENALVADLAPGDAIYIPYMWWHHVRSLDDLNMLVNYWWSSAFERPTAPLGALYHAMLAIRDMPPAHRDAWKAMFDHYVFEENGKTAEHLPRHARGIQGEHGEQAVNAIREALRKFIG